MFSAVSRFAPRPGLIDEQVIGPSERTPLVPQPQAVDEASAETWADFGRAVRQASWAFGATCTLGGSTAFTTAYAVHSTTPLSVGLPLTAVTALVLTSWRLSRVLERTPDVERDLASASMSPSSDALIWSAPSRTRGPSQTSDGQTLLASANPRDAHALPTPQPRRGRHAASVARSCPKRTVRFASFDSYRIKRADDPYGDQPSTSPACGRVPEASLRKPLSASQPALGRAPHLTRRSILRRRVSDVHRSPNLKQPKTVSGPAVGAGGGAPDDASVVVVAAQTVPRIPAAPIALQPASTYNAQGLSERPVWRKNDGYDLIMPTPSMTFSELYGTGDNASSVTLAPFDWDGEFSPTSTPGMQTPVGD